MWAWLLAVSTFLSHDPAWSGKLPGVNGSGIGRRCYLIVASLIVAAWGIGCDSKPVAMFRVGTFAKPSCALLRLAEKSGYFEDDLRIRLVDYSSATQTIRAFRNGSIEGATLSIDEALVLAQDFPDLRIILVLAESPVYGSILGRPGMTKVDALRGCRVGYEAGGRGAYLLARTLEQARLRPQDVRAVSIQVDEHEKAFTNGSIDCLITFDPVCRRLAAFHARELISNEAVTDPVFEVLVVRQRVLDSFAPAIDGLLRGYLRALAVEKQNPGGGAQYLGGWLKLNENESRGALQYWTFTDLAENRRQLAGDSPSLVPIVEQLSQRMSSFGLLTRAPSASGLLDSRALERLGPLEP
jgi:NitT/TauT family transport system substrate-binding protein